MSNAFNQPFNPQAFISSSKRLANPPLVLSCYEFLVSNFVGCCLIACEMWWEGSWKPFRNAGKDSLRRIWKQLFRRRGLLDSTCKRERRISRMYSWQGLTQQNNKKLITNLVVCHIRHAPCFLWCFFFLHTKKDHRRTSPKICEFVNTTRTRGGWCHCYRTWSERFCERLASGFGCLLHQRLPGWLDVQGALVRKT